jgi:hypothetical protein
MSENPETLLTVEELANKHGQRIPRTTSEDTTFSAAHLNAAVRHGWGREAHHSGAPVRMSSADYLNALAAARAGRVHPPVNFRPVKE